MTKRRLIVATRESPLAICQAELIKDMLIAHYPHLTVELLGITTEADKRLNVTLTAIGGKGLFVKELEEALLNKRADIAVHSMKDVPMDLPPGLCLPAICKRTEARDVFVSNQYKSLTELPRGAVVGTASLRRQTQLQALRSDLVLQDLRGNINTRLSRLDKGDFTAIILAGAGIKRMNMGDRIREYFSIEQILPSAGQGALGIECRDDDEEVKTLISPLNHLSTFICVQAERALCRQLNGGCQLPVASYAEIHHDELKLRGLVATRDGMRILRAEQCGGLAHAENIGIHTAEELLQQGADKILKEFIKEK